LAVPNGDYSLTQADWDVIRAFFDRHSHTLRSFAASHNLAIDEYYHDYPSWSFRFRHPEGGGATIHVERIDDSKIGLGTSWYLDDFENFTRYVKADLPAVFDLSGTNLPEVLEMAFRRILAYDKRDLTAHAGYEKFWSRFTKEEFMQMSVGRLPNPKI
jgi:hypothetical protein